MKVAGEMLTDKVYLWRYEQAVRIAVRAHDLMEDSGIKPKIVPPDFLLPFIESASRCGNPTLQELWARLFAAAVDEDINQHPALRISLDNMSTTRAHIMQWIATNGSLLAACTENGSGFLTASGT